MIHHPSPRYNILFTTLVHLGLIGCVFSLSFLSTFAQDVESELPFTFYYQGELYGASQHPIEGMTQLRFRLYTSFSLRMMKTTKFLCPLKFSYVVFCQSDNQQK